MVGCFVGGVIGGSDGVEWNQSLKRSMLFDCSDASESSIESGATQDQTKPLLEANMV